MSRLNDPSRHNFPLKCGLVLFKFIASFYYKIIEIFSNTKNKQLMFYYFQSNNNEIMKLNHLWTIKR